MPKKINYTARFADGTVITRKSHREYTHAWRVVHDFDMTGPEWSGYISHGKIVRGTSEGFSGSERLARSATAWAHKPVKERKIISIEIVPVEVTD